MKKVKVALLLAKDIAFRVFSREDAAFLATFAETNSWEELPEVVTEEFMKVAIKDAEVCITCWGTPKLTTAVLDQAPGLKLIAHGAGTPRVIVPDEAYDRGIRTFTAAPIIAIDVAETTLGFIILGLKRLWQFGHMTREGYWVTREDIREEEHKMRRLYHNNIGIISASSCGRNVIKLLKGFDVNILLYDPMLSEAQAQELGVTLVPLETLLSESEVVTIHAPNIPATHHLINRDNLKLLKDEAVLINTARGPIVDEQALIDELKTGRIFACIDVTDPEPPSLDNELRKLPNVILTPHIAGGHTITGRQQQGHYVIQQIFKFQTEGKLDHEVTREMYNFIA